jgi:hypothetical protein
MDKIEIYSVGPAYLSACVEKGFDINELTREINDMEPTGIKSKWRFAKESFHDGSKNPCQCERHSDREHILFNC